MSGLLDGEGHMHFLSFEIWM